MSNHQYIAGLITITVGTFILIGAVTGNLAVMIGALFDPGDLTGSAANTVGSGSATSGGSGSSSGGTTGAGAGVPPQVGGTKSFAA